MRPMITKESSPFTPGQPVPKEFFEGRRKELNYALQMLKATASGRAGNIFVIGERGIGKSSFANIIKAYAEEKENFLTAYVSLGGISELDLMVEKIFSRIVQENQDRPFFARLKELFKEHIREVGIFKLTIQLEFSEKERKNLLRDFLPLLGRIFQEIKERKKGILIVLDDVNGLSKNPKFANYIKSLVDENSISSNPIPLFLTICLLPERKEEMISHQESIARIFYPITLSQMSYEEVINFYKRILSSVNHKWEDKALELMANFSGGLPMLMQEIGEATYYEDQDFNITEEDAKQGVVKAAEIVGEKYLQSKIYQTIQSQRYYSILKKLARQVPYEFSRQEIISQLSSEEKRVFDNFIRKMKSLGVIEEGEKRGEYRFANLLYPLYIYLQAKIRSPKK